MLFVFDLFFFGFVFFHDILFIIEKYPDGWGVIVIILTGADRPDERYQEADGYQQADCD